MEGDLDLVAPPTCGSRTCPGPRSSSCPRRTRPCGISPWKSRYSSGWSSVWTASRFSAGSGGIPLGIAHEASTPSCSSRRSQCRRVAWCSWTTNRGRRPSAPPPRPRARRGLRNRAWRGRCAACRGHLAAADDGLSGTASTIRAPTPSCASSPWNVNSLRVRPFRGSYSCSPSTGPTSSACRKPRARPTFRWPSWPGPGTARCTTRAGAWAGVAVLARAGMELSDPVLGRRRPASEAPAGEATVSGIRIASVSPRSGAGQPRFPRKLAFLDAAARRAAEMDGAPLVLAGDFNIAPADVDVYDAAAFQGSTHVTDAERSRLAEITALAWSTPTGRCTPPRSSTRGGTTGRRLPQGTGHAHRSGAAVARASPISCALRNRPRLPQGHPSLQTTRPCSWTSPTRAVEGVHQSFFRQLLRVRAIIVGMARVWSLTTSRVRRALERALRLDNYDVELAGDGEEALDACQAPTDAVILDIADAAGWTASRSAGGCAGRRPHAGPDADRARRDRRPRRGARRRRRRLPGQAVRAARAAGAPARPAAALRRRRRDGEILASAIWCSTRSPTRCTAATA